MKKSNAEKQAELIFGNMREGSSEEQIEIIKNIKTISKPTGNNFWNLIKKSK